MDKISVEGVSLKKISQISNDKGDIYHALKISDDSFHSFGEAYFSFVFKDSIKGWKKHNKMYLNLIVPVGSIRFVIYDDRFSSKTYGNFYDTVIGVNNYFRLSIPPGVWVAFKGVGDKTNMLLNVASIEHDPNESVSEDLFQIPYEW